MNTQPLDYEPQTMGCSLLFVVFLYFIHSVSGLRDEVRLLKDLLQDYDTAARPVLNLTQTVEVRMGVALFQIRELDEKNQYLQINAWFQFHWTDPHLVWNASEYGGLTRLRIPSNRLWVPDIVLYNSVDETKAATQVFTQTNCIVSDVGYVLWVVPTMLKSSCQIDVRYFPFDQQKCPLKFGSWTYDGFQLDLVNLLDHGDMSKYLKNGEWDLMEMPAKRNVEYYSCCAEPYVDVTYTIIIKRKPMFCTYNLVFPCVLLLGIGILVFCLPPESGEKVSLGITVLLAMTVYQLLIAEAIPPTSEVVPLIGQFFGAAICLLSLSSAMTVVIMKLHFSGEHGSRVPHWMRKLVLVFLAKVVRMHETTSQHPELYDAVELHAMKRAYDGETYPGRQALLSKNNHRQNLPPRVRISNFQTRDCVSDCDMGMLNPNLGNGCAGDDTSGNCNVLRNSLANHERSPRRQFMRAEMTDLSDKDAVRLDLLSNVRQLNDALHYRYSSRDMEDYYKSEWRMVALVLDRLLLILFFIMTVFICVAIFVNVPH